MAWTATLVEGSVKPQAANPQNVECVVRFVSATGETVEIKPFGLAMDADHLAKVARQTIGNLEARDTAIAALADVTTITPDESPTLDAERLQFVENWNALRALERLGSRDTAIAAQQATLKAAVETYLSANPDAATDGRIYR